MREALPAVRVRVSGKVYKLDEVMKYIKRNNIYQASMFIVNSIGMDKDYATKLAMSIRDYWQAGMDPIQLSCSLVGRTAATAQFTTRPDEIALEEQRKKKEAKAKADAKAKAEAEKQAKLDALSPEERLLMRIRKTNEKIDDEDVTAKLNEVDAIIIKILARIEQKPEARRVIEDFYTDYLPKAVEVSEKYAKIYATGIDNDDTRALKKEMLDSLQTCIDAFRNLYERTYDEDMINLSTEIAALNNKLSYDGLTKSDFDISE